MWEELRDGKLEQVKGSDASRLSSFSGQRRQQQLGATKDAVRYSAGDSTGRELARHGSGHSSGFQACTEEKTTTANLRSKILDFRGFDSIRILILRVGILMSIGDFPEMLSQQTLVGVILVGTLGVACSSKAQPQSQW